MAMLDRRPVWVEIDLDALGSNMEKICREVKKGTLVAAVVKADAYGHGAIPAAIECLRHGADCLAVAVLDEAVELRQAGITAKILILGHTSGYRAEELINYGIDACVFRYEDAEMFSKEAERQHRSVTIHIGIDSGMGRIGYRPTVESVKEIKKISHLPGVIIEGIFTHFCVSDVTDTSFTKKQHKKFEEICDQLEREGVHIPLRHSCNSAALLNYKEYQDDMVRPGIILYGLAPSADVDIQRIGLQPVMSLKCRVNHIKEISEGDSISYGRTYIAEGTRKVASLPMGYADGLARNFSNKMHMLVHGRRVPQIGRICMDQCMIDVTDIPDIKMYDEVVIYGKQEGTCIPIEELCDMLGTIPNEMVCRIARRVPRLYLRKGKVVMRKEYLQH